MEDILCLFLRVALSGNPEEVPTLTDRDWEKLLEEGARHTVSGLLYSAVNVLWKDIYVPETAWIKLTVIADRISRRTDKITQVADKLMTDLSVKGLHPVLMKGPAVGSFYPNPLLRISGDLDFYFRNDEWRDALSYFQNNAKRFEPSSDGSFHGMINYVDVDLHNRYFDLHSRFYRMPDIPSAEATLLMLSAHILKHAMGTGVGLRQICDMAVAYRGLEGNYDPDLLKDYYRRTGTLYWNRILSAFIYRHLGIDTNIFPRDDDPDPKLLERIVFRGGNFGHYAAHRSPALARQSTSRKADTGLRYLKNLPFGLRCCPREYLLTAGSLIWGNMTLPIKKMKIN